MHALPLLCFWVHVVFLYIGEACATLLCQWASYQIRKIAVCACAGNAGNIFPATDFEQLVSDPGKHHGTCVTHVPWCMSGTLTRSGGENVPGIPGACATHNITYLVRGPLTFGKMNRCSKIYLVQTNWTYALNDDNKLYVMFCTVARFVGDNYGCDGSLDRRTLHLELPQT